MPAEKHEQASKSLKQAADNHDKAAKEYKGGNHEKGAHYAQTAAGHQEDGKDAMRGAKQEHAKKYGTK